MPTLEEQIARLADAVDAEIQPPQLVDPERPTKHRWILTAAAGLVLIAGVGAVAFAATAQPNPRNRSHQRNRSPNGALNSTNRFPSRQPRSKQRSTTA